MTVHACCAGTQFAAEPDRRDISYPDRDTTPGGDDGVRDLVDRADPRVGADQVGLAAPLDEVRADRKVGGLQRLGQF